MSSTKTMVASNPSLKQLDVLSGRWEMENPLVAEDSQAGRWSCNGARRRSLRVDRGRPFSRPIPRWRRWRARRSLDDRTGRGFGRVRRPLFGLARRFTRLPDELPEPHLADLEERAGLRPALRRSAKLRRAHYRRPMGEVGRRQDVGARLRPHVRQNRLSGVRPRTEVAVGHGRVAKEPKPGS